MRRISRLDLGVLGVSAAALIALAFLVWRGDHVGVTIDRITPADGASAASSAPVTVAFAQKVDVPSVESHFEIEPNVPGQFIWRQNTLYFVPQQPWTLGQTYTVRLRSGLQDQQGHRLLEDSQRTFSVRPAGLVFLRDDGSGYDVWGLPDLGGQPVELSHTNGAVFDFAPSVDGQQIVYSAVNDKDGTDLWLMDRDGGNASILLDCGPDRCYAANWSVDGRIAYDKATAPLNPGDSYGAPRVWLLDPQTGENVQLHADSQKIGYGPVWSPDAKYIAYYDGVQTQITVMDVNNGDETYLPSHVGVVGSWTPDDKQMIYYDTQANADKATNVLFRADFETQDILPFFDPQPSDGDYSNPTVSPDGNWVAVKVKPVGDNPGDQVWVMPPDGLYAITADDQPNSLFSNLVWDPTSAKLAYFRIELGTGNPASQIWIWDKDTGTASLAVDDAFAPAWLP